MSQGRGHFVCGAVFGIAIGFAVGHLSWSLATRKRPAAADGPRLSLILPENEGPGDGSPRLSLLPAGSDSRFEPYPAPDADSPPARPRIVNADAFRPQSGVPTTIGAREGAAEEFEPQRPVVSEPKPLPETQAAPLKPAGSSGSAAPSPLESLVDSELQGGSPHEREVWRDTLHGVPPQAAAEILNLWKSMGSGSPGLMMPGPGLPQTADLPPVPVHSSPLASLPSAQEMVPRSAAVAPATVRQLERNLLHASTPGYRQFLPEIVDVDQGGSPGCRAAALRIDLRRAPAEQTGNAWDLAIVGDGFFEVVTQDGTALTRRGTMALDSERRLGVKIGETVFPLAGEMRVPEDFAVLAVSPDGLAQSRSVDQKVTELGRISLVTVPREGELKEHPLGGGLLMPPEGGEDVAPIATAIQIEQGALESSNTRVEENNNWLQRLDRAAGSGLLIP
jgi:flagellar basal body rod protein FlgG